MPQLFKCAVYITVTKSKDLALARAETNSLIDGVKENLIKWYRFKMKR